jgi:hypothetical protein
MNPLEILLWALAGAVALIIAAIAVATVIVIIRAALNTPIGKQKPTA